jgi:uncharacterized protein YjiS (DUF1127 family)
MGIGTIPIVRRHTLRTRRQQWSWVRAFVELVATWRRRSYDRQELAMMRDDELRDVGLRRYDALLEAHKPFWRA